MEKYNKLHKQNNFERNCKIHGLCCENGNFRDSSRVSLVGLYYLNKHNPKAS